VGTKYNRLDLPMELSPFAAGRKTARIREPSTGLCAGRAEDNWRPHSRSSLGNTSDFAMRRPVTFITRVIRHTNRHLAPVAKPPAAVALITLMLLVAPMIGSCTTSAPSPTPPLPPETTPPSTPVLTSVPAIGTETAHRMESQQSSRTYTSTVLGIKLSYPYTWLLRETEDSIIIGTSEQVIAGGELTSGAGVAVYVRPLPNAEWESAEELCVSRASVLKSDTLEISEPQALTIDGHEAAEVRLQGVPGLGETAVKGFVAVAIRDRWSYTFVALSVADEWATYGAPLQAMPRGARFLAREEPDYAPDIWEPDDTLEAASPIQLDTSQTHDLHRRGDRDVVRFEATRGHIYTVETANLGNGIDTRILLYDCNGHLLGQDDDGRALEDPWASRLVWTAEKTCSHYVTVQDVRDSHAGPGTSYDLRIWVQIRFVEDEYEPDDSPRLATLLKPGKPQPHNLHVAGDVDWMRIEASLGNAYVIETFDLGVAVDPVLQLVDEEGNELAMDDNGRDEEEKGADRLRWTAREDGALYVLVHDAGDDAEGPGTQYWVSLVETHSY